MTGTPGARHRVPITALAGPAGERTTPTIDRITVTVAVSDGSTLTLDIPKPLNAGLDYRAELGKCAHNIGILGWAARVPCGCHDEQELVLAVELNPWRDADEPAYAVSIQKAPERGSSP